jgi:hypothetical protein
VGARKADDLGSAVIEAIRAYAAESHP